MSDEYSDETYEAWQDFSAAVERHMKDVRREARDWLKGFRPPKPLTQEQIYAMRLQNALGLLGHNCAGIAGPQMFGARPQPGGVTYTAGLFGGVFGSFL